jgi:hypothetical protein
MYPFAKISIAIKAIVMNGIMRKFSKFGLEISNDAKEINGYDK